MEKGRLQEIGGPNPGAMDSTPWERMVGARGIEPSPVGLPPVRRDG
jgi:hypothetical protein